MTLDEISTLCCLKDGYPCYGYNIVIFTLFILISVISKIHPFQTSTLRYVLLLFGELTEMLKLFADILGDPNIQVLFQMH